MAKQFCRLAYYVNDSLDRGSLGESGLPFGSRILPWGHETPLSNSFPDALLQMFSSTTVVAYPLRSEVTSIATVTMEAEPWHYYADVGEDWEEVSVGGASPASPPYPTALVNFNSVPAAPATSVLNHMEEAPLSLPLPPAIAAQPPLY